MRRFERIVPALLLSALSTAWAAQPDRIATAIDNHQTVVLKGNVHPKAQPQYDQGPVEPSIQLTSIRIVFTQSASQRADLKKFSAEQQDPGSPNYHKWLTPQQYGERFGLSQHDISSVVKWLQTQGFTIKSVANGRNWVVFSGSAAQVQRAFRTEIHRYSVDGETHIANATEPSIPKALAGVVMGFRGLNDFYPKPMIGGAIKKLVPISLIRSGHSDYTTGGSNYLAPGDIATIYDINPLFTQGYDGTGQNIAVVGQSDIHATDLNAFWTAFGLTPPTLNKIVDPNTGNPGFTPDEVEADLDLETVSGVAKNATIYYVFGKSADDAAAYIIDNQTTIPSKVISESFGICETGLGNYLTQQEAVAVQGNLEGVTWAASSGDTGAAACESHGSKSAKTGLAVSEPASLPGVTGVGGTEFSGDVNNQSTYWKNSNGTNGGSAIQYIPETAWNDTALTVSIEASGGGASAAFSKPSWQVGTGVPNDNARDVPDVAIAASPNHDGFLICAQGTCPGTFAVIGGTSASAPVFSGILVLLNHYLVKNGFLTKPGVGNANVTLYPFAQNSPNAFHDITTGNNIVPCTQGSTSCPKSPPFQFGFSAGTGYDQVTGLGTIDAYNFVTGWNGALKKTSTATTLAIPTTSPQLFGTSVTLNATVTPAPAVTNPPQMVQFTVNTNTSLGSAPLNAAGLATLVTTKLPGGNDSIVAAYGGDASFGASTSAPVAFVIQDFTITANPTTITIGSPGGSGTSTITIAPQGGFNQSVTFSCPSGLPSETTCTFNPASVTPNGAAATTTLTVQSTGPSARLQSPFGSGRFYYALLLPGLFGLVVSSGKRKRMWRGTRLFGLIAILALSTLWMPACGGGSSGGTTSNPGTPLGTSPNVRVSATTGGSTPVTNAATITVTVQ